MCARILTVCCVLAISTSPVAGREGTITLHPKDVDALKAAGITVVYRLANRDSHAFEITAEVPKGLDSLDANLDVRNDKGLLTSSAWQSSGGKCVAAFMVGEQALKDAVFVVYPHKGDRFALHSNAARYVLKLSEFAKPSLEPGNDSKKESKSSGMKERFRFEFWKVGAFQRRLVIQDSVVVNEPFNIRAKNGSTATGVLRRTEEGGLHFKGEVSHAGMSAVFDTTDERLEGSFFAGKTKGGPDSDGMQWIDAFFSLSHVEENVPSGLGLGVSGKWDQLIVVPGPKAEKQRPSQWFDSRLKADNVLTADQETWVLFRSKQLNPTRLRIERIERDDNTFTVTMNGAAATAGDDHYEVHGVNLGNLPAGTYAVKWIIGSGKRGRLPKDSKLAEPVELKSSFKILASRRDNASRANGGKRRLFVVAS
ncbi:MAG: hypothetical protein J5I93_13360 [Pirellulaceae bacterium]|nr:hypothetical protein [Pirellulaceae bacterium]